MLFLDTSALVKRYVAEVGSHLVLDLMAGDTVWTASVLAQLETQVTLCHLGFPADSEAELRRHALADWERFLVVPLAGPSLDHAVEVGCGHRLGTVDAIDLAAAAQLPGPVTFLTFDRQQAAAATALGFDVPTSI